MSLTTNGVVSTTHPLLQLRTNTGSSAAAVAAAASRLGDLAAATAAKMKAKQSGRPRQKASPILANNNATAQLDANGKKIMHHCQICNRGFLNKSNIKVHLRTHTGEKPFKCEHCSKAFRQKAHLLKHMSIHKRISRD